MHILILGAYGFMGRPLTHALRARGHEVTALVRSATTGRTLLPTVRLVVADIASLQDAAQWLPHLNGVDVVINASGALQESPRDHVARVQHTAIAALVQACEQAGTKRLIQLSAPGAALNASTEFMRSKARADDAIARSNLDWVILRPGLVIGQNAYGGSALLRLLAAFPLVQPLTLADQRIHTVAMEDVTRIVVQAVEGSFPRQIAVDLVEASPHALRDIIDQFRIWLGRPAPLATINIPDWMASIIAGIADALGYLGWRSPLRSTSMQILREHVVGDPAPLRALIGHDLSPLVKTLEQLPATIQERWFAQIYLLMPVMLCTLSSFWLVTGCIGLIELRHAVAAIPAEAMGRVAAQVVVVTGSVIDMLLGLAILYRPWARAATLGMVWMSLIYLAGASVLTPALWLDPLGPLVKILPSALLALVAWVVLEER